MKSILSLVNTHLQCSVDYVQIKSLILFVIMSFAISTANAQQPIKLKPEVYKHVVKTDTPMEVKVIDDGKIKETKTTALKDLQIAAGAKVVVPYEKNITVIDDATFQKIKSNPGIVGAREDYKILPELHIDNRGAVTEVYQIAFTLSKPFQYQFDQRNFTTAIKFFLIPQSGTSTASLTEPVYVEVVSDIVETITPEQLEIPHLNLPTSKVDLSVKQVSDSAEVRVITASKPEGYPTFLKVEPSLELFTNKVSLQGYGIQSIPVEVRFVGSNSPDSVKVSFSISKGSVEPGSMMVKYNEPSTITVRSEGTGSVQLSAITNNLSSNVVSLTFTFPWPFLLFSMIGGLIGGLIKHYFNAGDKRFPVKPIIGGMLIGFLVAVAYYFLGINLIGLKLDATLHEIAVLGLSALGAYFGINISPKPST